MPSVARQHVFRYSILLCYFSVVVVSFVVSPPIMTEAPSLYAAGGTTVTETDRLAVTVTVATQADDATTTALTDLINTAYVLGEAGIIVHTAERPFRRVEPDDVTALLGVGRLWVARTVDAGRVVGCVKVSTEDGEWGCLAVALPEQGKGVGSKLIDAAEEALRTAGRRTARLELLTPAHWVQEHKERLRVYYTERRGYRLATGEFATSTTTLTQGTLLAGRFELATDSAFTIYEKELS